VRGMERVAWLKLLFDDLNDALIVSLAQGFDEVLVLKRDAWVNAMLGAKGVKLVLCHGVLLNTDGRCRCCGM